MVCLTKTSRYRSTRWSWLVPLLPTFILSWLLAWSRIAQAIFSGQGQNSGHVGHGSGNGQGQGRGRGMGYRSKPKTKHKVPKSWGGARGWQGGAHWYLFFQHAKHGCNFVNWESMGIIFKIRILCVERIIFKIWIICVKHEQICVEHHLITRSSGVRWSWWLRWAKEQCHGSGYSSKPTKQGNGCAQHKGCSGARKKGRWPGYSTRPKSSKESWPEALAEQARSLGLEHWSSKQGVSTRFISWAMNKSRPDGTTDEQTDAAYRTIFEQMKREPVMVPLKRIRNSWSK